MPLHCHSPYASLLATALGPHRTTIDILLYLLPHHPNSVGASSCVPSMHGGQRRRRIAPGGRRWRCATLGGGALAKHDGSSGG